MKLVPRLEELVPYSYSTGYIVLSYLVSLAGCWTALELLNRRTSAHGLQNWYLLLGAAVTMGAVAIWSMHYVGNRAIRMANDDPNLQILYSPGFTAGSFFLPVLGVGIAFYLFSATNAPKISVVLLGGFLMGGAVCGMHYMGQGGIANYTPIYSWPWVLGSVLIAIAASTLALGVFFYSRAVWSNSWYKRGTCAALLAGAVSGMHWLASRGTTYRSAIDNTTKANGLSRQAVVIVVICLAIGTCFVLIVLTTNSQRSRRLALRRVRHIVLASALFDSSGRILVTVEGQIPCRTISKTYDHNTVEDSYSLLSPAFWWMYRASRSWNTVEKILPAIHSFKCQTNSLHPNGASMDPRNGSHEARMKKQVRRTQESFCLAAESLASAMQVSLTALGPVSPEILDTGTMRPFRVSFLALLCSRSRRKQLSVSDPFGSILDAKGKVIFTVRRITISEAQKFQSIGFRFTNPASIIDSLARDMQVSPEMLAQRLHRLQTIARNDFSPEPGVHLGCFILRPVHNRGFDVLVRKAACNLLPTKPLGLNSLETWQLQILQEMHGWTFRMCRERLGLVAQASHPAHQPFIRQLLHSICLLAASMGTRYYDIARLVASPLTMPSRASVDGHVSSTLIAFKAVLDIHTVIDYDTHTPHEYRPLKFFLIQQHCYERSRDVLLFEQRLLHDHGLSRDDRSLAESDTPNVFNPEAVDHIHQSDAQSESQLRSLQPLHFLGAETLDETPEGPKSKTMSIELGTIRVTNEVDVDICSTSQVGSNSSVEISPIVARPLTDFCHISKDEESYAEKLVTITTNELRRHGLQA